MLITQKILEQLTGEAMVAAFADLMASCVPDFAEDQAAYLSAMNALKADLADNTLPSVEEEMHAIDRQTVSNLLFSGMLGIKANLDNFINPITRNFLDVDSDVYLREEIARKLPAYKNAQNARELFYEKLSLPQKKIYEDIITYTSHLETVGPKLAHYYGYIFGNEFLHWVIPGYCADAAQTAMYTNMMRVYFGKPDFGAEQQACDRRYLSLFMRF